MRRRLRGLLPVEVVKLNEFRIRSRPDDEIQFGGRRCFETIAYCAADLRYAAIGLKPGLCAFKVFERYIERGHAYTFESGNHGVSFFCIRYELHGCTQRPRRVSVFRAAELLRMRRL